MGDGLEEEFTRDVHRSFGELRGRGMHPDEAAAMAIRIAAGAAASPPPLGALMEAVDAARGARPGGGGSGGVLDGEMRRQHELVTKFFGSLDAVQASFWPHQQPAAKPPGPAVAAEGGPGGSGGSGTEGGGAVIAGSGGGGGGGGADADLALDMDAVDAAYSALTSLRDDFMTDALERAADSLAREISAAHGGAAAGGGCPSDGSPAASAGLLGGGGGGLFGGGTPSPGAGAVLFGGSAPSPGAPSPGAPSPGSAGGGSLFGGGAAAAPAAAPAPAPGLCASPAALCRAAGVLLSNPALEDSGGHRALEAAAAAVRGWPQSQRRLLARLLARWGPRDMRRAVGTCQQYITLTLYTQMAMTPGVEAVTALLGLLSDVCEASGTLPFSEFYNGAVNAEDFNVQEDFRRWKLPHRYGFSFCRYPFVYDPAAKARVLQLENQITQFQQFESSMVQAMLGGASSPFLVLRVRRGPHLLRDTLLQINRAKDRADLRKPLKVQFIGEEGVDEGGVQKEFFQLLVRQAFNPEFGMFVYDQERHLHWFRASGLDLDMEFELIGILIGLAIYNSHILEFQFPVVLYKKLMGGTLGLADLEELHPEVHLSLSKLLKMAPHEVDALGLTFEVEMEVGFGELAAVDLQPGGAAVPVTAANRKEYARLYALHLLEGSVERQFAAFRRGFLRLCSGDALQLFRPAELEQLVCGGRTLDLEALEAATVYEDGYSSSSPVIRWFWEIAHALDDSERKRLLFFITGTDRVPIKGLGHLTPPFVITPNGGHSDRLPTAHTCFNHLLLPMYRDKGTLRARLMLALANAEGFGLQ